MADKNMEAQISVEFEEATSRQSLNSGETINTLWGKVKRWFTDLKTVCFSGSYNDLSDTPTTATTDTDGLMSAEDKGKLDNADNTYALKSKYGDTTIDVGRKAGSATGEHSTAEGKDSVAIGYASHAEGSNTKTWIGATSTLADRTVVIGDSTTVIVSGTQAYGRNSHAEGCQSLSYGENSHAEGISSAIGWGSHSEGGLTKAEGEYSHAEGRDTLASGKDSHAGGTGTKALHTSEVAYGRYNVSNDNTLFSVGDGASDTARHNAFEITKTGGKLHDKDIATTDKIPDLSAYAKTADVPKIKVNEAGNADTVGDFDAYHMGTTTYDGTHYPPEQFPVYCQYDTYDDGRFAFLIDSSYQPENSYEVRCDYAANAGNADTLGGKSISNFIYAHGYYTGNVDDIKYPFSGIVINATGTPPQTSIWGTMLCYGGGTGSFAQIWVSNDDNATMFVRHFDGNRWTEWSEIYASGNKPYITGSVTVAANNSYCATNHGFMPSAAIWWCAYSSGVGAMLSETGFAMGFGYDKDMTVNYLIFK